MQLGLAVSDLHIAGETAHLCMLAHCRLLSAMLTYRSDGLKRLGALLARLLRRNSSPSFIMAGGSCWRSLSSSFLTAVGVIIIASCGVGVGVLLLFLSHANALGGTLDAC